MLGLGTRFFFDCPEIRRFCPKTSALFQFASPNIVLEVSRNKGDTDSAGRKKISYRFFLIRHHRFKNTGKIPPPKWGKYPLVSGISPLRRFIGSPTFGAAFGEVGAGWVI